MCARLLACPLCSQPGFLTLDALRTGLISVATRPLICPVCNEVLLGMDKLTIHLFSHSINLNNNVLESQKQLPNISNTNIAVHAETSHSTVFQDWTASKTQSLESFKVASTSNLNLQDTGETSKSLIPNKDKNILLNSDPCTQNQPMTSKDMTQILFVTNQAPENERVNVFQECCNGTIVIDDSKQSSKNERPENVDINYNPQYSNSTTKYVNLTHNQYPVEQENVQSLKEWIQNQQAERHSCINSAIPVTIDKAHNTSGKVIDSYNGVQCLEKTTQLVAAQENKYLNFQSFASNSTACPSIIIDKGNEKNIDKDTIQDSNSSSAIEAEGSKQEEIISQLTTFEIAASKEKSQHCNICGFHFPDYNILLLHKQLVHMVNDKHLDTIPEDFFKSYSCHLCSKVFKMRGSLMVHMRVAHAGYSLGSLSKDGQEEVIVNENEYGCPTCGKKFKKEQHVIQHLKTHEGKQWECDVCSKMFTTKYFLKKHKRLHSGEMPYKCNICNKTFTFQQSYHKHRLYHKDDKPHTCTTCGRSFKELSTLHNHERIHTGEKPFACETCGKCFRQRVSYLVHRRIHTGVMPYKCTLCGKSFRYKVSQRTHKCVVQQTGSTQQAADMNTHSVQSDNKLKSNLHNAPEGSSPADNQSIINVMDNGQNKYVLIINTQGQHVLARDTDIRNTEASTSTTVTEEQSTEQAKPRNEAREIDDKWCPNIPIETIFTKSSEISNKSHISHNKADQDPSDFFSMVISPLRNGIPSSPATDMKHLHVSSPGSKEDGFKDYSRFKQGPDTMQLQVEDSNTPENFEPNNDNTLQTINEESLKQLLYGIDDK